MKQTKKPSIFTGSVKIDKIKNYMKEKNMTECQFAQKCHIEEWQLRKILDDYSEFEPIWLLYIARAMCVEFEDLAN